jgi:hypothetical protein
MKKIVLLLIIISAPIFVKGQEPNLKVLSGWMKYSDVENSLYHFYLDKTFKDLDKREEEISKLKTKADWKGRQEKVKEKLSKVLGEFPEKTPLNAKIIDVIQKEKFRVEKIIFESQPKYYVTAAMYIPKNLKGKTAAIIYTSGHSDIAFRVGVYQQVCINLVEKGFVVFAFDPVSQGERMQYLDAESKELLVGGPTSEHTYEGTQLFMIGASLANYMIWDGIRAVDYLLTRPEVDASRIGITGRSGGGTQSSYIAAFDKRIKAVAPENYITNFKRLWDTIGPQDAEQIFYHGIEEGLDHADLLEVRAPKPALQITTTRDFFSIQGAKETEQEIKKVYKAYNAENQFSRVEDNAEHAVTEKNMEALYAFFQRSLNMSGNSKNEKVKYLTQEELTITKTGQVVTSLVGETVFSLNNKEAQKAIAKIKLSEKDINTHLKNIVKSAKEISGYEKPEEIGKAVFSGKYANDRYTTEKYFIIGETGAPIPFLLFVPNEIIASPIIYLNPEGKSADLEEIEWLLKYGHPVLAADLIGFGEMEQEISSKTKYKTGYGEISNSQWGGPVVTGKSIVGIHAADIQRLVLFLKEQSGIKTEKIIGIAKGDIAPALVHAAAFEKSFSKIALIEPLVSYASVVMNKYYKVSPMFPFIPGILTAYDLPNIEAALAPSKLLILNAHDQLGKGLSIKSLNKKLEVVKASYENSKADENLQIKKITVGENIFDAYSEWIR